jgi:Flp pilus assembly protein TadG
MLVFGMIEYGRMIMVQQVLTNASREGARRAVLDGATTEDVQTVVEDYLENGSVEGATIAVSPSPPSSAVAGDAVTVSVSIPFEDVSWLPGAFYLGETTLNADTVMSRESPE